MKTLTILDRLLRYGKILESTQTLSLIVIPIVSLVGGLEKREREAGKAMLILKMVCGLQETIIGC